MTLKQQEKNKTKIPKCEVCENSILNPEWWGSETGMCGVCTTGESVELFHELWIAPSLDLVSTDEKFIDYWYSWYENIYLPNSHK